jgi:hypothetical protein
MARPKVKIDLAELEKLCGMQCTVSFRQTCVTGPVRIGSLGLIARWRPQWPQSMQMFRSQ